LIPHPRSATQNTFSRCHHPGIVNDDYGDQEAIKWVQRQQPMFDDIAAHLLDLLGLGNE